MFIYLFLTYLLTWYERFLAKSFRSLEKLFDRLTSHRRLYAIEDVRACVVTSVDGLRLGRWRSFLGSRQSLKVHQTVLVSIPVAVHLVSVIPVASLRGIILHVHAVIGVRGVLRVSVSALRRRDSTIDGVGSGTAVGPGQSTGVGVAVIPSVTETPDAGPTAPTRVPVFTAAILGKFDVIPHAIGQAAPIGHWRKQTVGKVYMCLISKYCLTRMMGR